MPVISVVKENIKLKAFEGENLRELLKESGCQLYDSCNGNGVCCGCAVKIINGAESVSPKTPVEDAAVFLEERERLSCQCEILGDLEIQLPSE